MTFITFFFFTPQCIFHDPPPHLHHSFCTSVGVNDDPANWFQLERNVLEDRGVSSEPPRFRQWELAPRPHGSRRYTFLSATMYDSISLYEYCRSLHAYTYSNPIIWYRFRDVYEARDGTWEAGLEFLWLPVIQVITCYTSKLSLVTYTSNVRYYFERLRRT